MPVEVPPVLRQSGFHGETTLVEALRWATGTMLLEVELSGEIDKRWTCVAASECTLLTVRDARAGLLRWAVETAGLAARPFFETEFDGSLESLADITHTLIRRETFASGLGLYGEQARTAVVQKTLRVHWEKNDLTTIRLIREIFDQTAEIAYYGGGKQAQLRYTLRDQESRRATRHFEKVLLEDTPTLSSQVQTL